MKWSAEVLGSSKVEDVSAKHHEHSDIGSTMALREIQTSDTPTPKLHSVPNKEGVILRHSNHAHLLRQMPIPQARPQTKISPQWCAVNGPSCRSAPAPLPPLSSSSPAPSTTSTPLARPKPGTNAPIEPRSEFSGFIRWVTNRKSVTGAENLSSGVSVRMGLGLR